MEESLDDVEELLLSRQPEFLDNYTFAAIFVNKIFVDPNRKRRIKKIVAISISVATAILILSLVLWMLYRKRQNQIEDMNREYQDMIEYIGDGNYVRAKERSRYADHISDSYIDKRLDNIEDYLAVFDYMQMGDILMEKGALESAEKKYLAAKSLAEEGQLEEAKKQYILAKEIYAALGDEDKVTQIENRIQMLEVDMQKNAADSAAGVMDVVDG